MKPMIACIKKGFCLLLCLQMVFSIADISADYSYEDLTETELYDIWNGVEERKTTLLEQYQSDPFPAVGDGTTSSWANSGYILSSLYLNRDVEKANEMIVSSLKLWPLVLNGDNYFPMQLYIRVWYLFRKDSKFFPGRLTAEAEQSLEDGFWNFVDTSSTVEEAKMRKEDELDIQGSENHDHHRRCNYFLATQLLAQIPRFQGQTLSDGNTIEAHFEEWNRYYNYYLDTKIRKGLSIEEGSKTYAKYNWGAIFNLRDLTYSDVLREKAEKFLDVLFASYAIEHANGVKGGASIRQYQDKFVNYNPTTTFDVLSYLFFGQCVDEKLTLASSTHPTHLLFLTSSYNVPSYIMDLALNRNARGTYTYDSHLPGRGENYIINGTEWAYKIQFPSYNLRRTYVTPDYMLGTVTIDRTKGYTSLTTQNRVMAIACIGGNHIPGFDSRIYPICGATHAGGKTNYNAYNGVSSKSAMIVQRLPDGEAVNTTDMKVFLSQDMYDVRVKQGNWIFAYDPDGNTYVGICPAKGRFNGEDIEFELEKEKSGKLMGLTDSDAPIVFQAGRASDYDSFEAFIADVTDNPFAWNGSKEFNYTGCGDVGTITWYTDTTIPKIDGTPVNLVPPLLLDSPYLTSEYDSGIVTIKNTFGEEYTLDFNDDRTETFAEYAALPREWTGTVPGGEPDADDGSGEDDGALRIYLNRKALKFQSAPMVNRDGSLLVPFRELAEAMGCQVGWIPSLRTATFVREKKAVSVTIDAKTGWVDGTETELDAPAELIDGYTLVPLRFISESVGATVEWEEEKGSVFITLPEIQK